MKRTTCFPALALAVLAITFPVRHQARAAPDSPAPRQPLRLADKTLVAWVYLANTTQEGGSVLTVQAGRAYKLRLVAVEGMVDVYVDDVLAINYFMRELGGGQDGLYTRGGQVGIRDFRFRGQAAPAAP